MARKWPNPHKPPKITPNMFHTPRETPKNLYTTLQSFFSIFWIFDFLTLMMCHFQGTPQKTLIFAWKWQESGQTRTKQNCPKPETLIVILIRGWFIWESCARKLTVQFPATTKKPTIPIKQSRRKPTTTITIPFANIYFKFAKFVCSRATE